MGLYHDVLLQAISLLPHAHDVLGNVWTCLPVATLSLCLACSLSLEQITKLCARGRIKTSSGAAGPVPHAELMWAAVETNSTYKKITHTHAHVQKFVLLSLLWTEIWEAGRNAWGLGHGWAQNRSRCIDRSVQLVLIPAYAYNCFCYFQEPVFMCSKTRHAGKAKHYVGFSLLHILQNTEKHSCCSLCCASFPVLKVKNSFLILLLNSTSFALGPGNPFPSSQFLLRSG